jgi:hypothetical protein
MALKFRVTTWAGSHIRGNSDGPRDKAKFSGPWALALSFVDNSDALVVNDHGNNTIRFIDSNSNVNTLIISLGQYDRGIAMYGNNIIVSQRDSICRFTINGKKTILYTFCNLNEDTINLACDHIGNIFVNNQEFIYKLSPCGMPIFKIPVTLPQAFTVNNAGTLFYFDGDYLFKLLHGARSARDLLFYT